MAQIYSGRDVGRFVEPLLHSAQRFLLVASPWISESYARLLVEKARRGVVVYIVTSDARGNEAALGVFSSACDRSGSSGRVSWLRFLVLMAVLGFGFPLLSAYLAAEHDWPWLMVVWGLAALYFGYRLVVSGWGLLLIPVGAAPWYLVFYAAYRLGLSGEPPRLEGGFLISLVLLGAYTAGVALLAWEMSKVKPAGGNAGKTGAWSGGGGLHVLVVPSRLLSHAKILVADGGAVVGSANLTRSGLWRNMETITVYPPQEAGPIEAQFWTIWEDARRSARGYIGCGATLDEAVEWVEPEYPEEGGGLEETPGSSRHTRRGQGGSGGEAEETGGEEGDPCGGDELLDLLLERGTEDPEAERRLREYMECRARMFIERFDEYEKRTSIRVKRE